MLPCLSQTSLQQIWSISSKGFQSRWASSHSSIKTKTIGHRETIITRAHQFNNRRCPTSSLINRWMLTRVQWCSHQVLHQCNKKSQTNLIHSPKIRLTSLSSNSLHLALNLSPNPLHKTHRILRRCQSKMEAGQCHNQLNLTSQATISTLCLLGSWKIMNC